jgi:pimeloyl-ACP methyl ester carboxylesterase
MVRGLRATGSGEIERDGAAVRYQVFGSGERAILLLPIWSIVHTDHWRNQVPHLARRYTVLTLDGLGNGASDRPTDPAY